MFTGAERVHKFVTVRQETGNSFAKVWSGFPWDDRFIRTEIINMNMTFLEKLAPQSRFSRTRLNVLLALDQFSDSHGYSPTVREISAMLDVKSHSSKRYPRRARSARLTRKAEVALERLAVHKRAA